MLLFLSSSTFTHSPAGPVSPGPFLLSWTLHPGDTWLFSATVLGTSHALCGLEGVMCVPICLDLAETHRGSGQVFAVVFSPFSLKSPLDLLWSSGLRLCVDSSGCAGSAAAGRVCLSGRRMGMALPCSIIRPWPRHPYLCPPAANFSFLRALVQDFLLEPWCRNRHYES